MRANDLEKFLVASACFMKDEGFAPEVEFRFLRFVDDADIHFRPVGRRFNPFVEVLGQGASLDLKQVNIGPSWQLMSLEDDAKTSHRVVQAVQRLLKTGGLIASIDHSQIPYDPT